jgi:hypothetical protein
LAIFFAGHFSRTHNRLQLYMAQLRHRGEKLTFQELGSDYTNNPEPGPSLQGFTSAVAGLKGFPLQPSMLEIRKFVGPGLARVVWRQDQPAWGKTKVAEGRDAWQDFGKEIDDLKPALAAVRDSLKAPTSEKGPPRALWRGQPIGDFVAMRGTAQWLAGAALYEVRCHNLQGALENLEALAALACTYRHDYRLVAQMIRVAVTNHGLAVTWEALQASGWTEPQLERLQKAWQAVDLVDGLEKSFLDERALQTEFWATLRGPGGGRRLKTWTRSSNSPNSPDATFEQFASEHLWLPAYRLTSIDDDELFSLQAMQEGIDSSRQIRAGQPWKQARAGMDQALNRINQTAISMQRFRFPISMMLLPNLSKAADTTMRAETERNLTITAVALQRFKLQHRALSQRLIDLVPEFLSDVPHDPMGGGRLRYQLKSTEDFCLYSVGEDAYDDGGDPAGATNNFGLWCGRDAVWPKPEANKAN